MNDTPLPLMVSAMNTLGLSVTVAKCASVSRITPKSWPSPRRTSQPNARNLSSIGPRLLTDDTVESDWYLLWSTITVISARRSLATGCSDSQIWPSCSSPSPVITTMRPPLPV